MLFEEAKLHLRSGTVPANGSDLVLDDYPEYKTSIKDLKASHQTKIFELAGVIFQSLSSSSPVRVVFVVGHADTALRIAQQKRSQFEQDVSERRAESVRDILEREIALRAGNAAINCMVVMIDKGVGSRQLRVKGARTEAEMRKNRRVEVFVAREGTRRPVCVCGT